jgi:hypothetical protein
VALLKLKLLKCFESYTKNQRQVKQVHWAAAIPGESAMKNTGFMYQKKATITIGNSGGADGEPGRRP